MTAESLVHILLAAALRSSQQGSNRIHNNGLEPSETETHLRRHITRAIQAITSGIMATLTLTVDPDESPTIVNMAPHIGLSIRMMGLKGVAQ